MSEALNSRRVSGSGPFCRRVESLLAAATGSAGVLLTTSCTHALEISALLLDVAPGDEVIVPAFTFVSTANAFALRGARLRFADSMPDTLNMDISHVEHLLTPRTRAVVPVHYGGVACDMSRLEMLRANHGFAVIEDNAHGLFGTYQGRPLGSMGIMATLSFHETKNYVCGEGGALLVNDPELLARAEIIREKGTNRSQYFRGEVDKYTWVDIGSSYVLADILAAFLLAQLEARDEIMMRRKVAWSYYFRELEGWAKSNGVGLPAVPTDCVSPYHLFFLLLPAGGMQAAFIAHMKERGVQCTSHYVPLNVAPMGLRSGGRRGDCPVAEDLSERVVRLPLHADLSDKDLQRVVLATKEFRFQGS